MNVYNYPTFEVIDTEDYKLLKSQDANYEFNKHNGTMKTWGKTKEEDAIKFPGPTILDLEITTKCKGNCSYCYKSNNLHGKNMSYPAFQKIFDKLPKSLTQVAFGADYDLTANPDIWDMMIYAKDKGVIPNITVGSIDDDIANKLAAICGAVAVSFHDDVDTCYDSVQKLTDRGMDQVNIHFVLHEDSYQEALDILKDIQYDDRLEKLNAIIFLSLKQKGRGEKFNTLSQDKFTEIVQYAFKYNIPIGFDSCSSLKFFKSLSTDQYNLYKNLIMPCESTLESSYINVDGEFFPCSFTEGTEGWEYGLSVKECKDFTEDVWDNERVESFRKNLISTKENNCYQCRNCPIYTI